MAKGENVFLRQDGRFEARYVKGRKPDGRLAYGFCYGKTYQEAKEKADQARSLLESGGKVDFSFFCDNWLSITGTRLKASSYTKYHKDIENHIKPFFGDKLPCEIRSEDIENFTKMLLNDKNLSSKTVRSVLALFRSILSYVEKRSGQKMQNLDFVYPKAPRKNIRVLDESEETVLIRFLAQDMDLCKFGVYMALRTGMRIGEICALKWCDISFKTSTISILHTAQRLPMRTGTRLPGKTESGKGGAGKAENGEDCTKTVVVIGTPKSESSLRTIPLMPDMEALCSRFLPENPEAFVLTGTDKCMDPRKLQRRLKKYMEECKIEDAHFHTLRHTFATRCVEVGFDLKTLSEILGHSNIGITLNQYVHPNLDLKRENMSRLKTLL